MTDDEIKRLVAETVAQTLMRLGVDTEDPLETQADMLHLRRFRKSYEAAGRQTLLTSIAVVVAGALAVLWMVLTKGN